MEGKLLNLPTHGFEETLNQLDSLRFYADFLWAVFPASQWASASNNHDRWKSELRQRGYGLLLVEGRKVRSELDAALNPRVSRQTKQSLLNALLGEPDEPMPISSLSSLDAETAIRAAARIVEIMTGPVREILAKNRKESTFTSPLVDSRKPYFALGTVGPDEAYFQGDPFSTYLNDGRALVWIWTTLGRLDKNEKTIAKHVSRKHPVDTYFFADNDDWQWICRPLPEISIDSLKAAGFIGEFALGRPLAITDRSLSGIKIDLAEMYDWARSLRSAK